MAPRALEGKDWFTRFGSEYLRLPFTSHGASLVVARSVPKRVQPDARGPCRLPVPSMEKWGILTWDLSVKGERDDPVVT